MGPGKGGRKKERREGRERRRRDMLHHPWGIDAPETVCHLFT